MEAIKDQKRGQQTYIILTSLIFLKTFNALIKVVGLQPGPHLVENKGGVLLYQKLVLPCLEHSKPIFIIEVAPRAFVSGNASILSLTRMAYSNPAPSFAIAVFQQIFAIIDELNLSMHLGEVGRLDVHGKVQLIRVARAEELAIWCRIDVKKFSFEDAICTLEHVIVIIIGELRLLLDFLQLLKGLPIANELFDQGRNLHIWFISNFINFDFTQLVTFQIALVH